MFDQQRSPINRFPFKQIAILASGIFYITMLGNGFQMPLGVAGRDAVARGGFLARRRAMPTGPSPTGIAHTFMENSDEFREPSRSSNAVPWTSKVSTDFNWSVAPSDDLSTPGDKTVSLPSCPAGVLGSEPWYYVYIAGTGRPEAVKVTGGTCKGNDRPGTLQFTTANSHQGGYIVGSASEGLQENSIAIRYSERDSGGIVTLPSREFNIYARVSIRASGQTIDFSGSMFNCYPDDSCIFVGDPHDSNRFMDITLVNPKGRPMIAKGTKPMIETNGNKTRIVNVTARASPSGGTFGSYVQVDDDQSFLLDGLNSAGGYGVRCDAAFCGSYVTAPGPFNRWSAVGWLKHLQISNQCVGNGVDWQSGNTLHVEDSVIQGFAQFGVRTGTMRGGYGPTQMDNVYMEVGSCSNPIGNVGQAGIIAVGSHLSGTTNMLAVGQLPKYGKSGGIGARYWVVIRDSVKGNSSPIQAGYAGADESSSILVTWPKVPGAGTVSYDVLRTTGVGNSAVAPFGTGAYAVATRIPQCSEQVCSVWDTHAALSSYTVVLYPSFSPNLMFWPGSIILSGGAYADLTTPPVTNISPIITTTANVPTVFAERCPVGTPGVYAVCLSGDSFGNNQPRVVGTLLQNGPSSGGMSGNDKGRLNFLISPNGSLSASHIITLVDSAPEKTLADAMHRPSNDDKDTYIGLDVPVGGASLDRSQLAFGAPVSISGYIGNKGNGLNWKERLTEREKRFAVPVVITRGNTFTLGMGTALSSMKVYSTAEVAAATVPPQSCFDLAQSVDGLTLLDLITGLRPPEPLGDLSLNVYASASNTLTLHFCNPTTRNVGTPSGVYSFLAVH
jgi:hypothetical protein